MHKIYVSVSILSEDKMPFNIYPYMKKENNVIYTAPNTSKATHYTLVQSSSRKDGFKLSSQWQLI